MKKTTRVSALGGMVAALLLLAGYGTAFSQGQLNFITYNVTSGYGEVFESGGITPAPASLNLDAVLLVSTTGLAGSFTTVITDSNVLPLGNTLAGYAIDSSGLPTTLPTQPGFAGGDTIYYELAVWSASAGSSYSTAYAVAQGTVGDYYGTSGDASLVLAGIKDTPPNANGFQSLTLTQVPEPTSLALMGLGGLSLLLFRRKNS